MRAPHYLGLRPEELTLNSTWLAAAMTQALSAARSPEMVMYDHHLNAREPDAMAQASPLRSLLDELAAGRFTLFSKKI